MWKHKATKHHYNRAVPPAGPTVHLYLYFPQYVRLPFFSSSHQHLFIYVIYDVWCFINRFCWLFFSSSLPLRSSPLKRLFHRKCKLPAAAVELAQRLSAAPRDSRTSEAKLWVWMLEKLIKFQTLPAALVLLPDRSERRWFSHKHYLSCCEKAAKFKMMVGNKRHRISPPPSPFCQLSHWAVDVVYLYKCCTTVITSGMAYYCVQLIYFYSI